VGSAFRLPNGEHTSATQGKEPSHVLLTLLHQGGKKATVQRTVMGELLENGYIVRDRSELQHQDFNQGRRRLLKLLAMLSGSVSLGSGGAVAHASISLLRNRFDLASWILRRAPDLFRDLSAVSPIKTLYLSDHPEEGDIPQLLWRMTRDAAPVAAGDANRWLAQQITRDLLDGEVVLLAGWVVARTEARLCVLADSPRLTI
jgi:hypothetical protein